MPPKRRNPAPTRGRAAKRTKRSSPRLLTRGDNPAPRVPSDGQHPIRRILAERVTMGGLLYYLIDWYPSWQKSSDSMKDSTYLDEWEANKKKETFKFDGDRVLKSTNSTEDQEEEHVNLMFRTATTVFLEHLSIKQATGDYFRNPRPAANRLFKDSEWVFARDGQDEERAQEIAEDLEHDAPSAAEVVRRTYIEMRSVGNDNFTELQLDYDDVQVKYVGQIDRRATETAETLRRRVRARPRHFLAPIFSTQFQNLQPEKWDSHQTVHENVVDLRQAVTLLSKRCPFLLNNVWAMFFIRMFVKSNEMEAHLDRLGIKYRVGWEVRTRDVMLYTYMKMYAEYERRAIDQVTTTYLWCRNFVLDHLEPPSSDSEVEEVSDDDDDDDDDDDEEENDGEEEVD